LREPCERLLAQIQHVFLFPEDPQLYKALSEAPTLVAQIEIMLARRNMHSYMTNYVSGAFYTEDISLPLLGAAIDNLYHSEFVGIAEYFETSTLIMAKKLGWRYFIPIAEPVRPALPQVPEDFLRMFRNRLSYDVTLYDIGCEIFYETSRQYGSLLKEATLQLKEIMQHQQPILQRGGGFNHLSTASDLQHLIEQRQFSSITWQPMPLLQSEDKVRLNSSLESENACISKNSPLDIWMNS
jgi:hypothetical protein